MDALTPKYKMPKDPADEEAKNPKFSAETLSRRLQKNKKKKQQSPSGMTSDDTKDDLGNSRLSTMRKVTGY